MKIVLLIIVVILAIIVVIFMMGYSTKDTVVFESRDKLLKLVYAERKSWLHSRTTLKLYWKEQFVDFQGDMPEELTVQTSEEQLEKGLPIHKEDLGKVSIKEIGDGKAQNWVVWLNPKVFNQKDFEAFSEALKVNQREIAGKWEELKKQYSTLFISLMASKIFPISYVVLGDYKSLKNKKFVRKYDKDNMDEITVSVEGNVYFRQTKNGMTQGCGSGQIAVGGDTLMLEQGNYFPDMALKISELSNFKDVDGVGIDRVYLVVER